MDKQQAEKDLLGTVMAGQPHQHPMSGEHKTASGSSLGGGGLEDEEGVVQAVLRANLQQLASPTVTTTATPATPNSPDTSSTATTPPVPPITPTPSKRAKRSAPPATPEKQASRALSPVVAVGKTPSAVLVNNHGQRIVTKGSYELCCEVLDNQKGVIFIDGPLTIHCGQLLGDGGLIAATGPIHLICQEFVNQEGQIEARQSTLTITGYRVLRNQGGLLKSQGDMVLKGGSLEGAGTIDTESKLQLSLQSEQTSPLQGTLHAAGDATIDFHGALESRGQLAGSKTLTLKGPVLHNSGQIAGERVNIQVTELANYPALAHPSAQPVTVSARQQLTINALVVSNLQQARLLSEDRLTITAPLEEREQGADSASAVDNFSVVIDNYDATIAARGDMLLQVGRINSDVTSVLQGGRQLTVESETVAGNGKLLSKGDLKLTLRGTQAKKFTGELAADGDATLCFSGELDNRGRLQASQRLTLQGPLLRNHEHAVIQARHTLVLQLGETEAFGLTNQGTLQGGTAEITGYRLDNRAHGIISAKDALTLTHQQVINRHSTITTQGNLILSSGTVENEKGQLQAEGDLTLESDTLQGKGDIYSGAALQIRLSGELPQQQQGTLRAKGDLHLTSIAPWENQGQLQAEAQVTVESPETTNRADALIEGKRVTLRGPAGIGEQAAHEGPAQQRQHSGTINNEGKVYGEHVYLEAQRLSNRGTGEIAGDWVAIEVTQLHHGAEEERTGATPRIVAHQGLAIGAEQLQQRGGALLSSNGALTLGRVLDAQQQPLGAMQLLENQGAHISAVGKATICTVTYQHDAHSSLKAGESLWVESDTVVGAGSITAVGDLTVHLQAKTLATTPGVWQAGGKLMITAPAQVKHNGRWEAGKALTAHIHCLHNEEPGVIRSNGQMQIEVGTAVGGILTNRGIMDGENTELRGHTLNNLGSGVIEGDQLVLSGDIVNNDREGVNQERKARLQARHDLKIAAKRFNNHQGAVVLSGGTLALGARLDSAGQLVGALEAIENQTASMLQADKHLLLESDTLKGEGSITSGGALAVILRSDQPVILHGPLQANGTLRISAPVELNNHTRWEAKAGVTVEAKFLRNHAEGSIRSEGNTLIVVIGGEAGRLNNRGTIDGVTTEIRGHSMNNLGSGAIYGDRLVLSGAKVLNDREVVNEQTRAMIIARQSLTFDTDFLCNREGALIMSAGSMTVGRCFDGVGGLMQKMVLLDNHSATIEVQGKAHFQLRKLHNLDIHFAVEQRHTSEPVVEYEGDSRDFGPTGTWLPSQLTPVCEGHHIPGFHPYHYPWNCFQAPNGIYLVNYVIRTYTRHTTQPVLAASCRPSKLHIGGDFYLDGELVNEKSQVVLGGKMVGPTQTIRQVDEDGTRVVENVGSQLSHWYERNVRRRNTGDYKPIHNRHEERVPLRAVVEQHNASFAGSGVAAAPAEALVLPGNVGREPHALQPWSPPESIQQVSVPARRSQQGGALVVRSSLSPLRLPEIGLFSLQLTGSGPVVVTDWGLRGRQAESSSALLLRENQLASTLALPRFHGDSFHEQWRIREQVIQLTGCRFLPGFQTDAEQRQALLIRGMREAARLQLLPGVALTESQQVALHESIVWPVSKPLRLANGQHITVLDLQLYVPTTAMAATGVTTTLLSAREIDLRLSGSLHNDGTIIGSERLQLEADAIKCREGAFIGGRTAIRSRNDIESVGTTFVGGEALHVHADGNLHSRTETLTATVERRRRRRIALLPCHAMLRGEGDEGALSCLHDDTMNTAASLSSSRTTLGKQAGFYALSPGAQMSVTADKNVTLTANQVGNFGVGGHTTIEAGQDLLTDVAAVGRHDEVVWDANHYEKSGSMRDIGTQVSTAGSAHFCAGGDIKGKGWGVRTNVTQEGAPGDCFALEDAAGAGAAATEALVGTTDASPLALPNPHSGLTLQAGGKIDLQEARATRYHEQAIKHTHESLLSEGSQRTRQRQAQDIALTSNLSGEWVTMIAGKGGIALTGTRVVGEQGTHLEASGDITVVSAENYYQQEALEHTEARGFSTDGNGTIALGEREHCHSQQRQATTQVASAIGSTQGNVTVVTQGRCQLIGSHLVTPQGDIDVDAEEGIDIQAATHHEQLTSEQQSRQSGLTLEVTNPLYSLVQTGEQLMGALDNTGDDPRLGALAAAAGGLAVRNTIDSLAANPSELGGVNASLMMGQSEQQSRNRLQRTTVASSGVTASGNVRLRTKGKASVVGSELQAGQQLTVKAKQLHLAAAAHQESQQSAQSSSSSAIGVGLSNGDVCAQARFSESDGNAQDRSCHYSHTRVGGEQGVIFEIEEDVIALGATVNAPQIAGHIGGNLTIVSVQDSESHHSKQQSLGVSASVGQHSASVSVNVSRGKLGSTFKSVTEQSGLLAGDQGFQLTVKGHTHLEGGKISSTQAAIDANRNSLITGSISENAIENHAEYHGYQVNLGVGLSSQNPGKQLPNGVGTTQQGEVASGSQQVPGSGLSSLGGFSAGPPVALRTGDSAHSTTRSGVSGGAITITNQAQQQALTGQTAEQAVASLNRGVTSDRDSSNALKPIFNKQKIEAGFAIAGTLAREAGTFLAHRSQEISQKKKDANDLIAQAIDPSQALTPTQRQALRREAQQLQSQAAEQEQCWGPGGHYRQITTALLAAVGGNITAGTGVLVQAAAVNYLQQNLAKEVGNLVARGMLTEGSPFHASLHALIAAGGAAASGQDVVSAAGGSAAASLLTNLFEPPTPDSTEEEKTAKRHLLTTLIAGVAAATGGDVTAAHTAATANIDNNWLASQQLAQMHREFAEAETFAKELKVAEKWGCIAGRQTLEILMGAAEGLATVGLDNITGMVEFLAHPIEGVKGLSKLISEPGVASQIGEQLHDYLQEKLANITTALQVGGRENARQLGRDVGEVIGHVISAVTGACGAVKGCAALGKLGIKLGKQGVAAAKTLHTINVAQIPGYVAKGATAAATSVKLTLEVFTAQLRQALLDVGTNRARCFNPHKFREIVSLSSQQKGLLGELVATNKIETIIPGVKVISKTPAIGQQGIDLVLKVERNGVTRYAIIEAKFGGGKLSTTKNGLRQMSDAWINSPIGKGKVTRLELAVGKQEAVLIKAAVEGSRVEKWLMHSDAFGHIGMALLDSEAKFLPPVQQISKIASGLL